MTPPTEDEVRAFLADWARLNDKLEADATFAHDKHTFATRAAKLRHALALLDEARKDRERVDWIEQEIETGDITISGSAHGVTLDLGEGVPKSRERTVRAAIDQARGA